METLIKKLFSWKLHGTMSGIIFMMLHALSMSILYIVVKILVKEMDSNQIGFLYRFFTLLIVTAACFKGNIKEHLKTKKIEIHILRGTFSILGSLSMFRALNYIGATDATALSKLEHTIMVVIGICFFKEKLTSAKVILLLGSILGAFFIFDFSSMNKEIDLGYFYVMLALLFWLVNNSIVKKLGRTERSRAQLFYGSLFASIFAFFFAIPVWQSITLKQFGLIMLAVFAHSMHKLTFFKAYKATDISIASPFDYMRLIITGILASLILGEMPDMNSLIGYIIITLSGVYFIIVEGKNNGFRKIPK